MRPRALLLACLALGLVGCPSDDGEDPVFEPEACGYPEGAAEPMELGEVLWPYAWPSAIAFGGEEREIALERVYCNEDDIDWSPFDVLLFVSYPAW